MEAQERLKRERNDWQELHLKTLPTGDKRSKTEGGRRPEHQSSSVETRDDVQREGSRWDMRSDLPRGDLSKRRISEVKVVINLWKVQCRRINRYIPDRPQSGPNLPFPRGFNRGHENMEKES
jgi:hypothetical protein